MLRKRTGSILCPSCGKLVGVSDEQCYNCGRKHPGMWGLTSILGGIAREWPFDAVVTGACAFLYLAMLGVMAVTSPEQIKLFEGFQILPPAPVVLLRFGASGYLPVFVLKRWWTVLSAGFLHGDVIHIAFNLYWLRMLAPAVAKLYGSSRMVVIYTVSSVVGFAASSSVGYFLPFLEGTRLAGAGLTVGASAAILGLMGAVIAFGRRTGSHALRREAWSYAIYVMVFGFIMPRVDNWAHLGGFAGGFLIGMFLRPEEPERPGHTAAALVCLALTVASVVASLVDVRFYAYL